MAGGQTPLVGIRAARLEDARQIADVHVAAWQAAYRGLIPQGYLDGLDPSERAARWERILGGQATGPGAGTLVAQVSTSIVGFASFGPSRDDEGPTPAGEVYAIYLHHRSWRQGIGQQLMAAALSGLGQAGFGEAILWVLDTNTRARAFYQAGGWGPDGACRVDGSLGISLSEIRYRRRLP